MGKKAKLIISIVLLIILTFSFLVIYNIAFATEKTQLEINEDQLSESDNLTGDYVVGQREVRSFIKENPSKFNSKSAVETYLSGNGYSRLKSNSFVFCLKHHHTLSNSAKSWGAKYYDTIQSLSADDIVNDTTNVYAYSIVFSDQTKGNEGSGEGTEDFGSDKEDYLSTTYSKDSAQRAIWLQTGLVSGSEYTSEGWNKAKQLWRAGTALDMYEDQVFGKGHGYNPEVTVEDYVGTYLLSDGKDAEGNDKYKYKIGPFTMSDYAYLYSNAVKDFSGGSNKDGLVGGITDGKLILKNDNNEKIEIPITDCTIDYIKNGANSRQGTFTHDVRLIGGGTAKINSTWSAPPEYQYPWPKSQFYIIVDKDKCGDATTLSKLKFTYQSTRANGKGYVATHNQQWQPLLLVNIARVRVEESDFSSEVNVRLTTDITVNKYIYDVEHESSTVLTKSSLDTTLIAGDGRKSLSEDQKKSNPVYVEYGDTVTYYIDLNNSQSEDVTLKLRDILPQNCEYISVKNKTASSADVSGNVGGNIITTSRITVSGKSTTRLEVKVRVKDFNESEIWENNVKIITNNVGTVDGDVNNVNYMRTVGRSGAVVNIAELREENSKISSSDFYKLNNYSASIVKYLSTYNGEVTNQNNGSNSKYNMKITNETNDTSLLIDSTKAENSKEYYTRYSYSEEEKENYPLAVEQNDTLVYSIMVRNDAKTVESSISGASKKATQIRPTEIREIIHEGLQIKTSKVKAKIYHSDGTLNTDYTDNGEIYVTVENALVPTSSSPYSEYKFTINTSVILNPGEYIIYSVPVTVVESNMYLYSLSNEAKLTILTNINHKNNKDGIDRSKIIKNDYEESYGNTNHGQESSIEFVRMKDLVISGRVWLDRNKNGYIDYNPTTKKLESSVNVATNPSSNIQYDDDYEKAMEGIIVRLYQIDPNTQTATNIRTVKTNNEGIYTFGCNDNTKTSWRNGTYSIERKNGVLKATDSDQRILKATEKNSDTQRYSENSKLYSYYIEYEYDGAIYKSTEVYSGMSHLKNDGTMNTEEQYVKDSNATEFSNVRENFNKNYEVISYGKARDGALENPINLEHEKKSHNSYLKIDSSRVMTARSFVVNGETKKIFLYEQGSNSQYPNTDYLKYINLGLEEREDLDLSVVQDVYEVHNTINGEEMTYWYNQNKFAKDGSFVDHDSSTTAAFSNELYMTGFYDKNSALTPYEFKYYLSDYRYKVSKYESEVVKDYKTEDSELNSEITFRIKVTNNEIKNDEPYLQDGKKDIKVYAGVNEIIEYYNRKFMNITYNEDGTVKSINVKTKDDNGYLVDTDLKIAEAKFILPNGTEIPAALVGNEASNSYIYHTIRVLDGYNTVYIRPQADHVRTPIILAEGENVDILIKFTVDKDTNREVKLGLKTAIAEIGAYSTYYKREDGTYYPAGLVDSDSNPANFGKVYDGVSFDKTKDNLANDPYLRLYEDDTFKSGINLTIPTTTEESERTIEGQVWDDARSNIAKNQSGADTTDGIQYIGDGKNGIIAGVENNKANENAKLNTVLGKKEKNDFAVNDIGVKLIELVKIPQYDASGKLVEERIYEETIKINDGNDSIVEMRTGNKSYISGAGKYILKGYIPGEYMVRFSYGDTTSDQMAIFNGQDYKSTTYQNAIGENDSEGNTITSYADDAYLGNQKDALGNPKKDTDKVLAILETKGLSDAKDDEIRRLETISYSETLNNNKILVLRGKNSSNKELQAEKTNMYSDTTDFLVRTEKVKNSVKTLTYQETIEKFKEANGIYRNPIENIDFGLQYRPEQQVGLNKFIKNITVTTSDGTSLVNANFKEYYGIVTSTNEETGTTEFLKYTTELGEQDFVKIPESILNANASDIEKYISDNYSDVSLNNCPKNQDGKYQVIIAGTELDKDNSIGVSNLQYTPNDKDTHDRNSIQGFAYLNIDDNIIQGAQVSIEYLLAGHNISEVDRVNKNLSLLRFKENSQAEQYEQFIPTDGNYSGALTARNYLYSKYYRNDSNGTIYRIKHFSMGTKKENNYYGSYLGSTYYTGKVSNDDIVAALRIDEILEYIDNNLEFKQEDNQEVNGSWGVTTSSELVLSGAIEPTTLGFENDEDLSAIKNIDEDTKKSAMSAIQMFSDKSKLEEYIEENGTGLFTTAVQDYLNLLGKGQLIDNKGITFNTLERSNLALMQSERNSDNQEDNILNFDITKYLSPRKSYGGDSFGKVKIYTSRVISAQEYTENMIYNNIAEIVQYSSVTGRITNANTTLGNVNLGDLTGAINLTQNSPQYEEAKRESDTASVEKVTLTPPTGLNKTTRIIRTAVKGVSYVGVVVSAIAIIGLGIFAGIKIYRKRRIK